MGLWFFPVYCSIVFPIKISILGYPTPLDKPRLTVLSTSLTLDWTFLMDWLKPQFFNAHSTCLVVSMHVYHVRFVKSHDFCCVKIHIWMMLKNQRFLLDGLVTIFHGFHGFSYHVWIPKRSPFSAQVLHRLAPGSVIAAHQNERPPIPTAFFWENDYIWLYMECRLGIKIEIFRYWLKKMKIWIQWNVMELNRIWWNIIGNIWEI